jgi:alpha-1,2-mannosyltransferase
VGRGELLRLAVLAAAVPLGALVVAALSGHRLVFNDFTDYWLAGRLVAQGRSPYDTGALTALAAAEGRSFMVGGGYSYPLPFAVAMVPLSMLPFTPAAVAFGALGVVLFGLAVALWIRWAHGGPEVPPRGRAALALAAGAYLPIAGSVIVGQANLVVLAALALGTMAALTGSTVGRRLGGGIAIGLAAIVKLVPAVLVVPLALGRRTAAVAGVVVGAIGSLVVASLLAPAGSAGVGGLGSLLEPDAFATNQSINGFVTRLVGSTDRTTPLLPDAFDPRLPVLLLTLLLTLVTLGLLWRARETFTELPGLALGIAVALAAGLAGAPKNSIWNEAAALVAAGLVLAVEAPDLRLDRLERLDRGLLAVWFLSAIAWAVVWLAAPAVPGLAPLATVLMSAGLVGALALWWLAARRLGRLSRRLPDRPAPGTG